MKKYVWTSLLIFCSLHLQANLFSTVSNVAGTGNAAPVVVNGGLAEDVLAYGDRTHQWNSANTEFAGPDPTLVGMGLVGADYIQTANDDKTVSATTGLYQFSLSAAARIWLPLDDRTAAPAWMPAAGLLPAGASVAIDEGGTGTGAGVNINRDMIVHTGLFEAGTHVFNGIAGTGNQYGLFATDARSATAWVRALSNGYTTPTEPTLQRLSLAEGSLSFVDRAHVYVSTPGHLTLSEQGLIGADFIQTDNDARSVSTATGLYELSLFETSLVSLFWDNRHIASVPTWVSGLGFTDSGNDIGIDEDADGSINQTFSVFQVQMGPGVYTFQGMGQASSANNYGLAVGRLVPEPGTFSLLLIGLPVLLRRFRR